MFQAKWNVDVVKLKWFQTRFLLIPFGRFLQGDAWLSCTSCKAIESGV